MEFLLTKSKLRPLRREDAEKMAMHGNNALIANCMRDVFPRPYTLEHANKWIAGNLSPENKDWIFAIEVNGEAAGVVSVLFGHDIHRLSAEIGYWIGETHWGKGIMTEAVTALAQYTLANTELVRLYGVVFKPNRASAIVLENAGFKLESIQQKAIVKNGEILDALMYTMIK